jgi:hypothetical protein
MELSKIAIFAPDEAVIAADCVAKGQDLVSAFM